MTTMTIKKTTM